MRTLNRSTSLNNGWHHCLAALCSAPRKPELRSQIQTALRGQEDQEGSILSPARLHCSGEGTEGVNHVEAHQDSTKAEGLGRSQVREDSIQGRNSLRRDWRLMRPWTELGMWVPGWSTEGRWVLQNQEMAKAQEAVLLVSEKQPIKVTKTLPELG